MPQRTATTIVILALVVLVAAVIATPFTSMTGVRGWYDEVTDGDADSGWDRLSERTREDYPGGRGRYEDDVALADWSALSLGPFVDVFSDDGFTRVEAELLSAPDTVPQFLFYRRLVNGVCENGRPSGISVYESRWPFNIGQFAAGGQTGGQRACDAAFRSVDP